MSVRSARRGLDLVGLDFSGRAARWRPRVREVAPLLAAALLAALLVAVLRVDLLRVRYALADAVTHEQALLAEKRELTVEMRQLRQPSLLAEHARERGFVRPEQVIRLPAVVGTAFGTAVGTPVPDRHDAGAGARP